MDELALVRVAGDDDRADVGALEQRGFRVEAQIRRAVFGAVARHAILGQHGADVFLEELGGARVGGVGRPARRQEDEHKPALTEKAASFMRRRSVRGKEGGRASRRVADGKSVRWLLSPTDGAEEKLVNVGNEHFSRRRRRRGWVSLSILERRIPPRSQAQLGNAGVGETPFRVRPPTGREAEALADVRSQAERGNEGTRDGPGPNSGGAPLWSLRRRLSWDFNPPVLP